MHALEGVILVDFGQYLAGPFGPMIIGDLGADVIKAEPLEGDAFRRTGETVRGGETDYRQRFADGGA